MSETRLPDIFDMEAWRMAGLFICRCPVPSLEWLGIWDCYQCRRCGKLVDR